jgi:hypothetical protein
MTARDDGGPAFPRSDYDNSDAGMTLRQYAAIKLCVPDSGTDWLDEMIRRAQRDKFAGQVLQWAGSNEWFHADERRVCERAYKMADAMRAESAKEGGAS